jgi:hypothetical protein
MMQEYDDRVIAMRVRAVVTDDHRLELIVPETIPPGEVDLLILLPQQSEALTKDTGGLDADVKRAPQFFQAIQQRAAGHPRKVQEQTPVDAGRAEEVRVQR